MVLSARADYSLRPLIIRDHIIISLQYPSYYSVLLSKALSSLQKTIIIFLRSLYSTPALFYWVNCNKENVGSGEGREMSNFRKMLNYFLRKMLNFTF